MPPAEAVARSLIEQIITFAWLAAKPEERLVEWVGWLYTERIKSDNKFKKWLRGQGRDGDPLFSDDARTAAEEASGGKALDLGSRAVQADETWRPQITALGEKGCSFAEIYASAYTSYSYSTHALAQPLLRYTGAHPDGGVYIGPEGALGESTPWGVGLVVYLLGLLVSSRAVGWPDSDEVYKLLRSA